MATAAAGIRARLRPVKVDHPWAEDGEKTSWTDDEEVEGEDPSLPFGGKVYLARRKKPDTVFVRTLEVLAVLGVICFIYYSYYHFDNLHFHVTHFYAHIGQTHAMHLVGQKYLYGKGVNRDMDKAMQWFRHAADRGHPHSSHNLAVGHLQGYRTDVKDKKEASKLLKFAAEQGVPEAEDALNRMCPYGDC